ncbi:TPA: hypothetical protein N0F65_006475 [Lagenidium giganteum]|uniref:Fe2OG dioxygenase domain-containing protein n=1 Tax=Lagenidium giganteum TaxID=4803 RepID=A0AAV2YST3_9STRA|nr:TPA: hypothetical protein N0F65_006475 [Lagenidium giganteum]
MQRMRVLSRLDVSPQRHYSSAKRSLQLPIVALDDPDATVVAKNLASAFKEFGFCYLTGHGISETLQQRTMQSARAFCGLPNDVKASIPIVQNGQGFTRGYIGIGKESGSDDHVEVKEAFSYGYEWREKTPSSAFQNGLQGHNVWPPAKHWAPAHRAAMNEFFGGMVDASWSVATALAHSLYGDKNALVRHCAEGDTISIMRLFHYFPYERFGQPVPQGFACIGSSPHTDWGFLTLILQDEVGGLQVLHRDEWIDVPYIPGTLVANAGDYLSLVTNGECVSPVHRVIADERERYSMVFFYYPAFDASIPSVFKERLGIGAHRGTATNKFNNLLDGTVADANAGFGEYIQAKWAGVQRS